MHPSEIPIDRTPPNSREIEGELLGSIMVIQWDARVERVLGWLHLRDFYDPVYQWFFQRVQQANEEGIPNTKASLIDYMMQADGRAEIEKNHMVSIPGEIGKLLSEAVPFGLEYHAERLRCMRVQRGQTMLSWKMLSESDDEPRYWMSTCLKQLGKLGEIPLECPGRRGK
jgi:hypothetical protein